jgi:predicted Zn-dependent protease
MIMKLLILLVLVSACGKLPLPSIRLKSSKTHQDVSPIFNSDKLVIKVYYEAGAEPYVDAIGPIKSWDLLEKNLEAMFQGKPNRPTIIVPKTLEEMTKIENSNKTLWTVDDVINLAKTTEAAAPVGTSVFRLYFINGVYKEESATIGFHINKTNIMAIYKDVIKSTPASTPFVPRYVEQATIIHEMGHAMGLVNNGVTMVTPHQDTEHGAHCSNPECVMYYSNEGATSMMNFAQNAIKKLSTVMFDQQCLDDAQNFKK